MAILSSDGKSVTVVRGDTLWAIARKYLGAGIKYKQIAAINNIPNPNRIAIGTVLKLYEDSSGDSGSSGGSGSGSSGGTTSTTTTNSVGSNTVTITGFGYQSDSDNVIFATWSWNNSNTDHYETIWYYQVSGSDYWFVGSDSTTEYKESLYSFPSNATRVKFKCKPVSETYTVNDTETSYWTADWCVEQVYEEGKLPPEVPPTPTVEIKMYKLTATVENVDVGASYIQFRIVNDNKREFLNGGIARIINKRATITIDVEAGGEYRACCCAWRSTSEQGKYSDYSSAVSTIPAASSGITAIKATSETAVYLEWAAATGATSYEIEYTTKKQYFDGSDQTTSISGIESTHYEKTGLESGTEYFFRVRAVNSEGESSWSDIRSIVIGETPAAPTTWSSSTTVITGEDLILYWVHNAEDGSSQTYAELEIIVDGDSNTYTIKNTTDEDEKDKTSSYTIDTSSFVEGTTIQWRVRTAGITKTYGEWSVQRTVDIYAPPTLDLRITDASGSSISTLTSFPFYIYGLPGPNTQSPISYHVTVTSNQIYETIDNVGNAKTINKNEEVYSKYFDTTSSLLLEMSAGNIDLANNVSYTVTCVVSMNSGLTAEVSMPLSVAWTEVAYLPNAEIALDTDTLAAYIHPYCEQSTLVNYKVTYSNGVYTKTTTVLTSVWGELLDGASTTTGEAVYSGVTGSGDDIFYCQVINSETVDGVTLSVYRREYDGTFTELATGLNNADNTFITDPHPALDFARYRVVAITTATGAVGFYDVPGYPVKEKAVIVQWDEEWSSFDTSNEDEMEQPAWSGSMLKLPYNVDVSDKHSSDVSLIKYIGRKRPVSYYGTQLGETSTWSMAIPKSDKETLYALRRLAIWMGDVYVREPSGSGYWANISVSFSQTHLELTIPVTLEITRVEGGV